MADASEQYQLSWAHGEVTVRATGGMIAPIRFDLGDGHSVSPLHAAPWASEETAPLSPLMAGLRGEWPCLPYGPARIPENLPAGWKPHVPHDNWDHGYCSNQRWWLIEKTAFVLSLGIDLPDSEDVARLERHIRPDPDAPAIEVELVIHPRRDAVVPFALHPTFVVPPSGVEIVTAVFDAAHTYPMQAELGVSRLTPGKTAPSLTAMPADGGALDLTRLPLPFKTEELLQVEHCKPPFVLRYPAWEAEVSLDWDTEHLPDALLWISNGGRAQAPWSGRHYALGIEPDNGCFDLSRVATPAADHPLAHRTGIRLKEGKPVSIKYRLSARNI